MKILAAALAILVLIICGIAAEAQNDISFSNGYYYINGEKTFLKGIGYEVGAIPGQLPWEREFDEGLLRFDMERILSAGFNSIRTWAAFTEEELEVIDDYEIYVIMGIWIDPHGDFSNPSFVAEARDIVEEVMAYSQNFDNIVGYLIMNEPLPETVFSAGYDHTVQLWNELTGIIHDMHPGVPVSMANTPNGTYIDPLVFDFSAYNVYIYNPVTVNLSHGYAAYAEYLQQLRTDDGPLIYTEFGLSVSPEGPGSWGYGGNTLQEQQEGDLFMYRAAIDGGAAGAFMFNYSDGWWKSGNEYVHDPYPEEWFGLIEYQDLSDKYGQPRPIWDACANYNRAIITEPKNGRIYIHKVPVEIFAGGDVQAAQVTEDGNVVFNSIITGNYFADSIIFTGNAKDRTLIFKFFDAGYNLLKEESITVLTADGPVDMPVLTISTSIEEWDEPTDIGVDIDIIQTDIFSNADMLDYATYRHYGFEYGDAYSFPLPQGFDAFNLHYEAYITEETPVVTFAAGYDIIFGDFKKRIFDQKMMIYEGYLGTSEITWDGIQSTEVIIYPNPAANTVRLFSEDQYNYYFTYSLYDLQGRLVLGGQVQNGGSVDISRLHSGLYLVSIKNSLTGHATVKMLAVN